MPLTPLSLSRAAAVTAASALALSLTPALSASAAPAPQERSSQPVVVQLKVAESSAEPVSTLQGTWPGTLLDEHGVPADRNDLVIVKRDGREVQGTKRRVRHGDTVKVVDVTRTSKVKKVKVRPRTVTVATTRLEPGRRKVVAQGRPAVVKVKVRRTLHNDQVVKRTVVSRAVVRKAEPRRVLVGRKATPVPGADGLNWGALARCESGGNPRAVNPAGYYGLYQFNVGTWNSVGGSGMPHHASPAEQTLRAKILYKSRGRSPWPHCGRYL